MGTDIAANTITNNAPTNTSPDRDWGDVGTNNMADTDADGNPHNANSNNKRLQGGSSYSFGRCPVLVKCTGTLDSGAHLWNYIHAHTCAVCRVGTVDNMLGKVWCLWWHTYTHTQHLMARFSTACHALITESTELMYARQLLRAERRAQAPHLK